MASKLTIELSPPLVQKIQELIQNGWLKDEEDFIDTAARYYLERHSEEMWRSYVEHEIKVGLHEI